MCGLPTCRLTEAAEKAKCELSNLTQTSINLPFITATPEGPKHIDAQLSRVKCVHFAVCVFVCACAWYVCLCVHCMCAHVSL